MRTSNRILRAGWTIAIALALGLSGCGGSSAGSDVAAQAQKNKAAAAHGRQNSGSHERPATDMVAAVSASKAGPPVELKFELQERPEAGQPLDVDIALLPDAPSINRIYVKFQGGEGFKVVEGDELTQVDKPAAGTVVHHQLRVVPKQDGIFALSAIVSVDLANDSLTRTFSIPVIVGEGVPEPAAKAEVTDGQAASGTVAKTH